MVPEIGPDELAELLAADDAEVRVVDIRSPAVYSQGHIPDSENVPFPRLPQEAPQLADADRLVTVCPHGKDSIKAARILLSHEGIDNGDVVSLRGGLTAWDGEVERPASDGTGDSDGGPVAPF